MTQPLSILFSEKFAMASGLACNWNDVEAILLRSDQLLDEYQSVVVYIEKILKIILLCFIFEATGVMCRLFH